MKDTFNGDNAKLCASIEALLSLDAAGSLVPHGVGGHARTLLESAATRLSAQPPAVAAIPEGMTCPRSSRSDCALFDTSPRPNKAWYTQKIAETEGLDSALPSGALAPQPPAGQQDRGEAVGVLCVSHYLGDPGMENIEYQSMQILPPGTHLLYTDMRGAIVAQREVCAAICDQIADQYAIQARGGDNSGASDHREEAARACGADIRESSKNPKSQAISTTCGDAP